MEKNLRFELKRLQVSSLQHKNIQFCLLFVEELNECRTTLKLLIKHFITFQNIRSQLLKKHENKFDDIIVQTKFCVNNF